jgi:uncharacterized protein (TIGR02145 family)
MANWSDAGGIAVQMGSYIVVPLNETSDWVHLVHVMDHGVERVYIDGVLQGVYQEEAYENQTYCSPFTVGAKATPAFDPWPGLIDDIGIWNRALTDAEVMALYLGEPPVAGCTDATACNFNPEANAEDGSCVPSGCLDAAACNFNAAAGCGGVACDFTCCPGPGCCGPGTTWDATTQSCAPDPEFIAAIEAATAAEAAAAAVAEALDGVCGLGTVWHSALGMCICALPADDCPTDISGNGVTGVEDLLMLLAEFAMDCPVAPVLEGPCAGATAVTYHDHTYPLIAVGSQCWFQENLRTSSYLNGDLIPGGLSDAEWTTTTEGAQAVYNEDPANLAAYGRLYNWYAVNDPRGLCPSGWHVPTEAEWTVLENELGGAQVAGVAMKSSQSDNPPWDGSNESGFSGLPGGGRNFESGVFYNSGTNGYHWSTSLEGEQPILMNLFLGQSVVEQYPSLPRGGFSIRCVKTEGALCFDPDEDGVCAEQEISGCTNDEAPNYESFATEDNATCVIGPWQCNGISGVSFDGYSYPLVGIGEQCWFKENLRTNHYRNGDSIPSELDGFAWQGSFLTGAFCVYGEGESEVQGGSESDSINAIWYGHLYNWSAVQDIRGLCPSGFHVPSDIEWAILTSYIGVPLGTQMKASANDVPPWNGNNASGFSATPGGHRSYNGGFFADEGQKGFWWSSTSLGPSAAWYRSLGTDLDMARHYVDRRMGYSVRCLKD